MKFGAQFWSQQTSWADFHAAAVAAEAAECPAIHAAIGASRVLSVDPRAIRFAASNADIAAALGPLETLPARLSA